MLYFPLNVYKGIIARVDLHLFMAVYPPMSHGIYVRKFLRSTSPRWMP